MRFALVAGAMLLAPLLASAREGWRGWCEQGNNSVVTSGISSTTKVQRSFPRCQVLVLVHGGAVAQIYSDNQGTVLANPFQANLDGSWEFFADDGRYDVNTTMAGLSFTYLDILLCDPFVAGAVCSGASSGAHNLLSTTHLDTIPFSPPVRGDIITAQNQTSPTGVNPSWARLPLGTINYVLTSNGTDAIWAPAGGGSVPCTTLVAGTWDIVPQTCAGEKVIQGIAGNASTKNFVILPASDQTAINLYSGDDASTFTNISAISLFGDNPLAKSFNTGAMHARSNGGGTFFSGLLGYNEDTTGGGALNPVLGNRCVGVGSGSGVHGTIQACEGEAYLMGSGSSTVVDAYSAFASVSDTASTSNLVGFYSSRNKNRTGVTANVSNNYGLFIENQGGIGNNNYEIFAVNASGKNVFFVASDTGHVNIPILETARLKRICYSITSLDTLATFVPSTCFEDTPSAFASIGTCNAGNEGAEAVVNNSTTATHAATITGGGANHVKAYCDGTNWVVEYP